MVTPIITHSYSRDNSRKIRRGIRESALKAKATGGGLALGYKIAPDKSFELDENEAKAVKIIFDMFIERKTNAEICAYLNGTGFRTSRGEEFNKNSIPRLVRNEKYIGVYKCGDIRLENAVPAIVSRDVFYAAQKEVERRRTSKQASLPRAEYLLSGKLFCGHCKGKMIGVSGTSKNGGKFYYYYCTAARGKKRCDKKQVSKDWLEDLIVSKTLEHILRPDAIKYIASACYELQLENRSTEEADYFRRRIAENRKALDNTMRAIETGVPTTTLPERLRELELEQLSLLEVELAACDALLELLSDDFIARLFLDSREYRLHDFLHDAVPLGRGVAGLTIAVENCLDNHGFLLVYRVVAKREAFLAHAPAMLQSVAERHRSAAEMPVFDELRSPDISRALQPNSASRAILTQKIKGIQ